jgi:predicted transcriptional regulator of viral defense system
MADGERRPQADGMRYPIRAAQEVAEGQSGMITVRQATQAGVTPDAIRAQLEAGRWQRIYPGVYATFTGPAARAATLWAAVLRAGAGAALSHQTAAELYGLTRQPSRLIHVTVPADRRVTPAPGLVIHRSGRLATACHPALQPPRTRVEDTVLDLAGLAREFDDALGWVCAACAGRLTTPAKVGVAMSQRAKQRFRDGLLLALTDIADGAYTVLEHRYLRDVERAHHLPRARRQVRIVAGRRSGYRDAVYDDYQLAVETDGRLAHLAETRWRDLHRDNAAAADGIMTLRYSWSDVTDRPCLVAMQVGAVLSQRGWPGPVHPCSPQCAARPPQGP